MLKHEFRKHMIFFMILFIITGCAHVISPEMRKKVVKGLSFPTVLNNPESFIGEIIILGGVVIETLNRQDGTVIKLLETPLDYRGRPEDEEYSRGRFLAKTSKYLDSEVYRRGRKITLAGKIIGKEVQPLGKIHYTYPVVLIKELHLWKEEIRKYWGPYQPYFYWDWYWYPYYWPHYRFHFYYW